jgi:hypothetical protein
MGEREVGQGNNVTACQRRDRPRVVAKRHRVRRRVRAKLTKAARGDSNGLVVAGDSRPASWKYRTCL